MIEASNCKFPIVILLACFYAVVEVTALYNIKTGNVGIALICYLLIVTILMKAYEYEGIGHMNLITSIVSISLGYTIGHMYLEEKMNKYTILAMIFAVLAIYFAYLSDEK